MSPRSFYIHTLGCRVNQYESEQIATLLRARGLVQADKADGAELRIVHTCSVTTEAGAKSRQSIGRMTRLPILQPMHALDATETSPSVLNSDAPAKVVVTGCWATSDTDRAKKLPGVEAVITHHQDVAAELTRMLDSWLCQPPSEQLKQADACDVPGVVSSTLPPASEELPNKALGTLKLPLKQFPKRPHVVGAASLPLLGERQTGHQRAYLKVQDGCDAHCTYCIIPNLRPTLWSKPLAEAITEAQRLVDAGHVELVLTGIFLGAYGAATALRRKQNASDRDGGGIARLVESLCTHVSGLKRLRLSSLEPGDLTPGLIATLKVYPQVVPHFHLPLQSGSDLMLRRMNRQYSRAGFLDMIRQVSETFDRPALTTDVIVGFPGETEQDFLDTLDVVEAARFIHVHAFPFSPRPGTAAARWENDFVETNVSAIRLGQLRERAASHSLAFRNQFVGETVEILVERSTDTASPIRHGRCERYFDVHIEHPAVVAGDLVQVRIDAVTVGRTHGSVVGSFCPS